jgi:hypothetical protein
MAIKAEPRRRRLIDFYFLADLMRHDWQSSTLRSASMATQTLPILRAVGAAYHDAWRALLAMRTLVLCAALIILAVKVVEDFVPMRAWSGAGQGHLLSFLLGVVESFCLTPIMIAVHRFIILDEVTPGYVVDPGEPSFLAFFVWFIAFSLLRDAVFATQEFLTAIGFSVKTAAGPALMVLIVLAIVSLRLTILFPAIAVKARGANASNALADSKGHVLYIFAIFLLALLPTLTIALSVTFLIGRGQMIPGTPAAMLGLVGSSAIQTAVLILSVAVASHLFQALGSRLLRPQE